MENKNYKKCPYCKLNYIPLTDVCCKICYIDNQEARRKAISQRKKVSTIRKQQQIEQDKKLIELKKVQEFNSRKELLNLFREFGFVGFLHTSNFNNFIEIYKSGLLKSRNHLTMEGVVFEDNAETAVLEKTSEFIKTKVRFYYRPITPTNISAFYLHNQKNPVLIAFDEKLIFEENVLFCDGCAGSNLTIMVKSATLAKKFDWGQIFSMGSFNNEDFILKNHRNAEFLINSPISLKMVVKFYFKNYGDYIKACELFKDDRFEYNPHMFY